MLLHTVNKSPSEADALASCLRGAAVGSCVLLLENGIYAAIRPAHFFAGREDLHLYALREDLHARGLLDEVDAAVTVVDYDGFVDLSARCHGVHSWY